MDPRSIDLGHDAMAMGLAMATQSNSMPAAGLDGGGDGGDGGSMMECDTVEHLSVALMDSEELTSEDFAVNMEVRGRHPIPFCV